MVAIPTIAGAMGGATFGIDHSIFRKWFTVTNNLYDGDKAHKLRVERVRNTMQEFVPQTAAQQTASTAEQMETSASITEPSSSPKEGFRERITAEMAGQAQCPSSEPFLKTTASSVPS